MHICCIATIVKYFKVVILEACIHLFKQVSGCIARSTAQLPRNCSRGSCNFTFMFQDEGFQDTNLPILISIGHAKVKISTKCTTSSLDSHLKAERKANICNQKMMMLVCGPGHAGRESPDGGAAPGAAGRSGEAQKAAAGPASGPPSVPHAAPPPQLPELAPCSQFPYLHFSLWLTPWF